jgi:hypothetical protein
MLNEIKGFLLWLISPKKYVLLHLDDGYFCAPGWNWDLELATRFTREEARSLKVSFRARNKVRIVNIIRT